jgi:DNA-binding MarR family transcriptional regulator
MAEQHKVENRWGGGWGWPIGDSDRLTISDAIMCAGPGDGVAVLPWALDRYERALRLRPGETWLLKRMLKHAWTHEGEVFLSQRKISFEARVSRNTVASYVARLEKLGYIRRLNNGDATDRRIHYSVSGIYAALALCIAADPTSVWAQQHGAVTRQWVATRHYNVPGHEEDTVTFDLDWWALDRLAKRSHDEGDGDA